MKKILPLLFLVFLISCKAKNEITISFNSDNLKIIEISKNVWIHTSYLEIPDYGKFPCNGLIYVNDGQAVVFDTPINNQTSLELIKWIQQTRGYKIKAVIINHFHNDCLGGLNEFHKHNIDSYANDKTIELALENEEPEPKIEFQNSLDLIVGDEITITKFFGPGHTSDNVVSYIPSEKILFGGCLIKAIGSGKGNLTDSNTEQWSKTVQLIKDEYDDVKIIIPGHGNYGDKALLNYTINMFKK